MYSDKFFRQENFLVDKIFSIQEKVLPLPPHSGKLFSRIVDGGVAQLVRASDS